MWYFLMSKKLKSMRIVWKIWYKIQKSYAVNLGIDKIVCDSKLCPQLTWKARTGEKWKKTSILNDLHKKRRELSSPLLQTIPSYIRAIEECSLDHGAGNDIVGWNIVKQSSHYVDWDFPHKMRCYGYWLPNSNAKTTTRIISCKGRRRDCLLQSTLKCR